MSNKEAYKHDFSGSCAPGKSGFGFSTFSVGIFQWIPKASGKGLKKSAVKYRVKGYTSDPKAVYARARTICELMNIGWKPEKKSETVGTKDKP